MCVVIRRFVWLLLQFRSLYGGACFDFQSALDFIIRCLIYVHLAVSACALVLQEAVSASKLVYVPKGKPHVSAVQLM